MNLLQIGIDASRGLGDAHLNQFFREANAHANLGMNHYLSTISSYNLIENTLSKVNEVLQNVQRTTMPSISPFTTFFTSLCIPLSLTAIKQSINYTSHPNLHCIITTLDNSLLPNVILVTNLVASVALITLGSPIYGGVNLTFLLFNLVDEQGWLNTDYIQKNSFFNHVIYISTITKATHSLLINHSFNPYHIWTLIDAAYRIGNWLYTSTPNRISTITLEDYKSKYPVSEPIHYRLNDYHLFTPPVSSRPIEDLTDHLTHYASLLRGLKDYAQKDFSIYASRFLNIFQNDEKWINDYKQNPIDYLNNGINKLIDSMTRSNTQELKNKSLALIKHMSNTSKDDQINFLASLAVVGHYCPERQYIEINLLYDTYIDKIELRTLSNKVLDILHDERKQILDQMLVLANNIKPLYTILSNIDPQNPILSSSNKRFIHDFIRQVNPPNLDDKSINEQMEKLLHNLLSKNTEDRGYHCQSVTETVSLIAMSYMTSILPLFDDVHFANLMKNALSPYIYVHHKSIDTLTKLDTNGLIWKIMEFFIKHLISIAEKKFSQYTPSYILQRITDSIEKEPTISTYEIIEWFKENYIISYPTATLDQANQWIREELYTEANETNDFIPTIKPYYVLFFLVNQGVLTLEKHPQSNMEDCKATEMIDTLLPASRNNLFLASSKQFANYRYSKV